MSNILTITPKLHEYIIANSLREPEALTQLRQLTTAMPEARMVTLADQGQFIGFLLKLIQAKRVIEIGTFTGCGTFSMALALPENGEVISCDIDEKWPNMGKPYWEKGGVSHKIHLKIGDAIDTLNKLIGSGENGCFDAVFIDADKEHYEDYYELSLQLVRTGGLVLLDNVLWSGRVIDESNQEASTINIRQLNKKMHHDERIDFTLITVGDGMALALKK